MSDRIPLPLGQIGIVKDPLFEQDFLGSGVCYRSRAVDTVLDTLIIHSVYVNEPLIARPESNLPDPCTEQDARDTAERWQATRAEIAHTTDPGQKDELIKKAGNLELDALHLLIRARNGALGLSPFSRAAVKDIFQFYGVSAHYLIDREGAIYELVSPDKLAFHAGKSKMPRPEDGRESVNHFGIGVELLGTLTSGYTDAQYQSVARLSRALAATYPIRNFYGHCHIAPGRKTDPDCFDWERYKSDIGFDGSQHFGP